MKNAELAAIEEQLLDALPVVKRVLRDHPEPKETLENLIAGTIGWLRHGQDELAADKVSRQDMADRRTFIERLDRECDERKRVLKGDNSNA